MAYFIGQVKLLIMNQQLPQYICPICQSALIAQDNLFKCQNNHCFDIAKENYVNLLPVQFKKSKQPGDNKAMVNARRLFLSKGHYQPLVDKILALYKEFGNNEGNVLDAGCGEGFYTHQHKTNNNNVYGVDIAKEAVKKAAKKYPSCHFSVGTLSQLAFKDSHFNWLYSIYAPILEQEYTRLLESGGYLLTVTPAQKHLFQLKEMIYQSVDEHNVDKDPIQQLSLIHQESLSYELSLDCKEDRLNLLAMTPFAFKANEEVQTKLRELESFNCQVDFMIRLYKK